MFVFWANMQPLDSNACRRITPNESHLWLHTCVSFAHISTHRLFQAVSPNPFFSQTQIDFWKSGQQKKKPHEMQFLHIRVRIRVGFRVGVKRWSEIHFQLDFCRCVSVQPLWLLQLVFLHHTTTKSNPEWWNNLLLQCDLTAQLFGGWDAALMLPQSCVTSVCSYWHSNPCR